MHINEIWTWPWELIALQMAMTFGYIWPLRVTGSFSIISHTDTFNDMSPSVTKTAEADPKYKW